MNASQIAALKPEILAARPDILLVDDQPDTLRLLSIMLNSQGYTVRRVANGSAALREIHQSPPDLILLDIRMPGMDGYEVCQRLKAAEETASIPIIFLSALSETLDKIRAFKVGGADFISKPFQFAEILARIENQITLRSLQDQLQDQNHHLQAEIQQRQQTQAQLDLQRQKEQALHEVIQKIRNSLDLQTIFFTAVSQIGRLLKLDFAYILEYKPEDNIWMSSKGYRQPSQDGVWFDPNLPDRGNPVTTHLKRLTTIQVDDVSQLRDETHPILAQKSPGSWLLVPLRAGSEQEVWGCLSLLRQTPQPWQDSEVQSAQALADQLGIAIRQGQLYEGLEKANDELARIATCDGLTQVANRRRFEEYISVEWREARREQTPLAVILCDVDYFKRYNDTYGHLAGDDCLKAIAQALMDVVKRPDDLVARYGGEEFAMVLPRTDLSGAAHIAQAVRLQVQSLQILHEASSVKDVISVSLGVASIIPEDNFSPQDLLARADQALYQAKAAGRDRLALHGLASISSVA
jgi:two-component system, cell cycle response regulator